MKKRPKAPFTCGINTQVAKRKMELLARNLARATSDGIKAGESADLRNYLNPWQTRFMIRLAAGHGMTVREYLETLIRNGMARDKERGMVA